MSRDPSVIDLRSAVCYVLRTHRSDLAPVLLRRIDGEEQALQSAELDRLVARLQDAPAGTVPSELCRDVVALVGVDDVSLSLIGAAGQRHTLCGSSEQARTLDQWQFTLEEGPCLRAAQTGEVASAPTSDPSVPWPELAEKARELGYEAIAGVPLAVAGVTIGALNLQARAGSLSEEAIDRAVAVAERLAPALLEHIAGTITDSAERTDRAVIHQATGMVAGQLGVSVTDALAALRARAWSDDRLLDDLAQDVLRGDVRLDRA